MRKFLKAICFSVMIIISASSVFADETPNLQEEPLSPAYLEWLNNPGTHAPNGYTPSPVNRSHLSGNPPVTRTDSRNVGDGAIPSAYDLRNVSGKSYVPSVRNQGQYGTCWAHAALGAMESNYLRQGASYLTGSEPDLSELHLSWFVYQDPRTRYSFSKQSGSFTGGEVFGQGGNADKAIALMSRIAGPVNESVLPYTSINATVSGMQKIIPSSKLPEDYPAVMRLHDAYTLGDMTSSLMPTVKQLVMNNGAVEISYYSNQTVATGSGVSAYYKNSDSTYTYYNTSGATPNHAVLIVGWDDSFSASKFSPNPGTNGAWLVRNSWGGSWGQAGYFWMSYKQNIADVTAYITEPLTSGINVYCHDPLGMCGTFGYMSNSAKIPGWAANVFRAEGANEILTQVSLITTENNAGYAVYVYKLGKTKPSSLSVTAGGFAAKKTGTITYAGYHVITLDDPVKLDDGEYFAVVVNTLNTGAYNMAIEREASYSGGGYYSQPSVNAGESYFAGGNSFPTSWTDGNSMSPKRNACIKAFTVTGSSSGTAPSITTTSLPDGKVSSAYSATLAATGTSPITWTFSGNVPAGLTGNTSTGEISGTPTQAGTYTFTAKASNAYGSDTKTFTLTITAITPTGYAPNIVTATLPAPSLNTAYSQYIYAEGTAPITFSATGTLPAGLTLAGSSSSIYPGAALISGTPTAAGTYTFTVTASNAYGTASQSFTLTVSASSGTLTITTDSIVDGYTGQYFSQTMTATSTQSALISWAVTSGTLPAGLSISRYGTITGTPTAAGTYSFTLKASNTYGTAEKAYTMTVRTLGNLPRITTRDLPYGLKGGSGYRGVLTASGTGAITWAVTSGSLPAGLSLNASTGIISGTPSAIGTYIFTVRASDSNGSTLRSFTIYVYTTTLQPDIDTAQTLPDGKTGTPYYETLNAFATSYVTWAVTSGTLPAGLTLDSQSGVISGTPTSAGTFTFTVRAANAYGSASKSYTIKITASSSGTKPAITTTALPSGEAGKSYSASLTATGTTPITWTAQNLPAGLAINSSTGAVTGTPTAAGTYSTVITASNSYGTDSKTYTLTISAAGVKPSITTDSLPNGQAGKSYSATLSADGTAPITWTASGLPSGVSLNTSAGRLSGTPSRAGTYRITITARNSYGTASKTFTVTIAAAGVRPTISTSSLPDGKIDAEYSQTLTASGTAPLTWAVTSGTLPAGLSINASTGVISGTPTESGTFTFTVTASNEYGTASKSYTLNIIATLDGDSVNISGYVGYAVRQQLSVSASGSVIWRALSSLPSGLSLSRAGLISGTPRTAGNFSVKVTATAGTSVTEFTVNFSISARPVRPTITTSILPNATVSEEYSRAVTITGTAPITVTATGLPEGLTFNSGTWLISGIPSKAGTYNIRFTAENVATRLENRPITRTVRLVVRAQAPKINAPGTLSDGIMGEAYNGVQFTLSQGTEPVVWRISGQPSGMRMSSTGLLSGTPSRAGKFNMTVRASNSGGNDSLRVPLTILQKPEISSARMANGTTDITYTARFTARGTAPITWSIEGLPDGMSFEQNTAGTSATVRGIPTVPGTYSVSMSLSNEAGTRDYTVNFIVRGVAPRLTATLSRASVGQSYTGSRIYATGTKPMEITHSISDSDLVKFGITSLEDLGLKFTCNSADGTAKITGTPEFSLKNLPITFTARNIVSSVTRRVYLTIAGSAPRFTAPSASTVNMTCEIGSDIDIDFTVTGSKKITYSMTGGSGFTLTQTGDYDAHLSGTAPARDTTTTITVKATNADGSATKRVIIRTQTPPKITTASLPSGTVSRNYSARVTATGTSTIRYTISGTLPAGLRFSNGTFSGRPTQSGNFTVTITATNSIGTDSKEFTITINS